MEKQFKSSFFFAQQEFCARSTGQNKQTNKQIKEQKKTKKKHRCTARAWCAVLYALFQYPHSKGEKNLWAARILCEALYVHRKKKTRKKKKTFAQHAYFARSCMSCTSTSTPGSPALISSRGPAPALDAVCVYAQVSKETYYTGKRDLLHRQKRPTTQAKETYYTGKRDLLSRPDILEKSRASIGCDKDSF